MKKLIIIRGYPGSGKTTVGKALESWIAKNPLEDYPGEFVVDADADIESVASRIRKFISAK